jgi:translation initiation factor 1
MSRKKLYNTDGIVYSTEPGHRFDEPGDLPDSLLPAEQPLTLILDKKHRSGRVVTIIKGMVMKDSEAEDLSKKLKTLCGSGGSVKDHEIMIQGDHREKILQWLLKNGYKKAGKI